MSQRKKSATVPIPSSEGKVQNMTRGRLKDINTILKKHSLFESDGWKVKLISAHKLSKVS